MCDIKCVQSGNDVTVTGINNFMISQTFDCGQCFRFDSVSGDSVCGIAFGRVLEIFQPTEDKIIVKDMTVSDFDRLWKKYLGLDEDYYAIRREMIEICPDDTALAEAMRVGYGIRIMNQDPWETLCSFIISQNNNIPRIKGIIKTMSERFGDPIYRDGKVVAYDFPSPESICYAGVESVFDCKTGFRAKYIIDAAQKVASGEIDLKAVAAMDTKSASDELCKIKGVGKKVAACSLLFGFGKKDAFPIDVWVKRVLAKYYGENFNPECFGRYAGIAQQYLFYYERYVNSRENAAS